MATLTVNGHGGRPSVIEADLNFFDPSYDTSKTWFPGTLGSYRRKWDTKKVLIHDIRGHESQLHLDRHGFQLAQCTSTEDQWFEEEQIKTIWYPEVAHLLKEM